MNAAKEVGGDFYDFFLIDEDRLGFLIADVSGKGIPAALFMMTAKTEIQNYMMNTAPGDDIGEAIATVNHHLCIGNEAEMFVTAFLAILNYETGEMTYVNAGHNPPLLRHGGTWEWLRDISGVPLAAMDDLPYKSFTHVLSKGDEILLYTDGVTEAWCAANEMYGEDRLIETLQKNSSLHPTRLVHRMENELATFAEGVEQADDITMLALEFGMAPTPSATLTVSARPDKLGTVIGFMHKGYDVCNCPKAVRSKLDIAIEEMFVNVARYAYPDAKEPGKVRVTYSYDDDPPCFTIEIADSGTPFNPFDHKDPERPTSIENADISGFGIVMAKRSVDVFDYRYSHGSNILSFSRYW